MSARLHSRLTYANVTSTIALFVALGAGGAYAADTIGSSDIIDESILSQDIKNGEVKNADLGTSSVGNAKLAPLAVGPGKILDGAVTGAKILDGEVANADIGDDAVRGAEVLSSSLTGSDVASSSLTGSDVASSSLTGSDVATDSLTGSDVLESSLSVSGMGCQSGKVLAFARVKGGSGVPSFYTDSAEVVDTKNNCAGGTIQVRRSATGVYFVRFNGLNAKLAIAISNSDGFGTNSSANDNLLSVNRITGGADVGAFRIEIEDVNGSGTDPEDNWFTIAVV